MNIFFDLDGTLIDSRRRLHELFVQLTAIDITFEDYWFLKRDMVSNEAIMRQEQMPDDSIKEFSKNWMLLIEHPDHIVKDVNFSFTLDVLEHIKSHQHPMFVVTARQSKDQAIAQLKALGILNYLTDVLVTEQKLDKKELINLLNIELSEDDVMVGDTGHDIMAGKALGIKTVAVTSGFRSEERLLTYSPDYIFKNVLEFSQLI